MSTFSSLQRAFQALCLILLLSGCSSTACREWVFIDIITSHACFNSGKLILEPENTFSYLQMEIVRSRSGIRMYLNILLMQAEPCENYPKTTKIEITLSDETLTVYAELLDGGQRILIPGEVADLLIDKLQAGESFTVRVGTKKIVVIPDHFQENYSKLLAVEI